MLTAVKIPISWSVPCGTQPLTVLAKAIRSIELSIIVMPDHNIQQCISVKH